MDARKTLKLFSPTKPVSAPTTKNNIPIIVDNARENIDPNVRTKVLQAVEVICQKVKALATLSFFTNNTERMTILADGKVGIGTSNPQNSLQIGSQTGSASVTNPVSLGATYSATEGLNPKLKLYDDGTNIIGIGVSNDGVAMLDSMQVLNGGFAWYINGVEKVRIHNDGLVAIGNTTPSASLDIKGVGSTDATYSLGIRNSSDTYALVVRNDGNVGINKTNPSSKFAVIGLPTASAGLTAGDVWVDTAGGLNILKIVL